MVHAVYFVKDLPKIFKIIGKTNDSVACDQICIEYLEEELKKKFFPLDIGIEKRIMLVPDNTQEYMIFDKLSSRYEYELWPLKSGGEATVFSCIPVNDHDKLVKHVRKEMEKYRNLQIKLLSDNDTIEFKPPYGRNLWGPEGR